LNTTDERLLRARFAVLAGPPDGDWRDVRRRAGRRSGTLAIAAIAVVAALVAAGLAVGGRVIGLFDVKGSEVPLSSFTQNDRQLLESMCPDPEISHRRGGAPRVACRSGEPTVRKIADDGVEVHWRVHYPWGLTCVASGPVGGRRNSAFGNAKITNLGCNAWAPGKKVVPTPQRPITVDASMGSTADDPRIRLFRVTGLAGEGVAAVGLVSKVGPALKAPVRGSAYSFRSIPVRPWIAIAAYDAAGKEVYREPLRGVGSAALSPVTTPAKVWSPGPPKRPTSPPLQRASTADAVVDVYRNGVVEVQFTSTDAEAYRRLVRTSRFSSDTAGVDCLKVGFGAGRWEAIGGGSNAHVGPLMGTRLGGGRGAHPIGGMPSPPFDVCQVSGTYGRYWNDEEGTRELVEVPFTAIGRRYLDERATCRDLAYLARSKKMHAIRLGIHRGGSAPSADELVRIFGPRLVPMASREGSAANGKVGVWSDGKLIIASELTPAGRRLYVTINALRIGPNNIRDLSFVY
jgi:hypothetical protein